MPGEVEIPEEAVEAVAHALYEEWMFEEGDECADSEQVEGVWSAEGEGVKAAFEKQARAALQAAAPSLRAQGAEEARKSARRIAEQVEIVCHNLANVPASPEAAKRISAEVESLARLFHELQAGAPHHDIEWETLEAERDEALAAGLSDEDRGLLDEFADELEERCGCELVACRDCAIARLLRKLATPKEETTNGAGLIAAERGRQVEGWERYVADASACLDAFLSAIDQEDSSER